MNWINKVTPPGLKTMMLKKDTPDDLWVKCPVSGELIYKPDLEATWNVTPAGAHLRISPRTRFRLLFDDERWEPVSLPPVPPTSLFAATVNIPHSRRVARSSASWSAAVQIGDPHFTPFMASACARTVIPAL